MDLGALEDEFAANSWPKTAEKTELLLKLVPLKTVLLLSFFLEDPVYQVVVWLQGLWMEESGVAWIEIHA